MVLQIRSIDENQKLDFLEFTTPFDFTIPSSFYNP